MGKRVLLMLFWAATGIMAQPGPPNQAFTCVANAGMPVIVRVEGITELVGDLLLQCQGGTPTPKGQVVPSADVTAFLNTGITNRLLAGNFIDALLLIDEPLPVNQLVAPYDATTGSSFSGTLQGTGTGINFAGGTFPNTFLGSLTNVNGVTFQNLPIDPNGGQQTIRITNLFANANELNGANPGATITGTIILSGSVFGTQPIVLTAPLGTPEASLGPAVIPNAASHQFSLNASLINTNPLLPPSPVDALIRFPEGFPGAFSQHVNNNVPANFNDPAALDETARLRAVINGIPDGVGLFVSTVNGNQTLQGGQIAPRATASGPQATLESGGTPAGSTGLSKLTVTNGTATAVWKVTGDSGTAADTFSFSVYPAFISGGTIETAPPAPTDIKVQMSFASQPGGLQFAAPAGPPQTIFTINAATGLTPQLSASVDARPCIIGERYPDPANACSPGNNPQIAISSDSGRLTPLLSPATTGGVNIKSTLTSGSTPVDGTLTVTAPGAAPGVYQQTLNITASGAANSLSLPYSVTVLPPTNPFIKPGGVVDAFSFAGGSIAPGQIFALFGSNFGPSSGLVSGTVTAGIVGTTVANTQVLFDGVAAPLLYVTRNQLAGVAPFGIKGKTSTNVQLVYNNVKSPVMAIPVSATSLSIASVDGSGGAGGVIINKDGSVNSASNPAAVGDTVIIYAAYAGPFANGVTGTDGRTTTGAPYPAPAGPVSITIGGVAATSIPYFGNAPTLLESVMQINVVIPGGVKAGATIPVTLAAGSATSSAGITIAIR